jgi:hypothetical protein
MVKSFIWTGIVILAIGVVVGAHFVVPHIGMAPSTALNGLPADTLSPLAVLTAASGLAAGCTLIGIGIGHWKHPRHTGPSGHGDEI